MRRKKCQKPKISTFSQIPCLVTGNKSVQENCIPSVWKTAEVTAIFKKGAKNDPGNYRPVSLTCIACKILESFIRDQIVNYMEVQKSV